MCADEMHANVFVESVGDTLTLSLKKKKTVDLTIYHTKNTSASAGESPASQLDLHYDTARQCLVCVWCLRWCA